MSAKKCKLCGRTFTDKKSLIKHIDRTHKSQIPENWTASRYENYLRTSKTHGNCIVCKSETDWNEATEKYCRLCRNPACRTKLREQAELNLMKSKGITHSQMLSDPEFQRKMVYSKKNSGIYRFGEPETNNDVRYDSSYGKDFLEMLDLFMNFSSCDILGPSPNTYIYVYKGKQHFYIPDFYIPSLHLEIEIKDGGDNPNKHPKIQSVDKVKEALKDEAMSKANVNYVKISNKDYTIFFKMLFMLKERSSNLGSGSSEYTYLVESLDETHPTIDSWENLTQWIYSTTPLEQIVSSYEKLDRFEDLIKLKLNQYDLSDIESLSLQHALTDIQHIREKLQSHN